MITEDEARTLIEGWAQRPDVDAADMKVTHLDALETDDVYAYTFTLSDDETDVHGYVTHNRTVAFSNSN